MNNLNPKLFWTIFTAAGALVIAVCIAVILTMNNTNASDCKHGVMVCVQAKKTLFSNETIIKECDKVYCRAKPKTEEKWSGLPY